MKKTIKLNPCADFQSSLFFWFKQYLRHKMVTISYRLVYDKKAYKSHINEILDIENMEALVVFYRKMLKNNAYNISSYYLGVKKLYDFLLPLKIAQLEDIDEDSLNEFLMLQDNLSNATKKSYRRIILNFFKFIEKRNSNNFAFGFEINIKNIVSSNVKLPRYLQLHELKTLHNAIKSNKPTTDKSLNNNFIIARDNLILSLLMFGGIRTCEVAILTKDDIKEVGDCYIISVLGKCSKYRNVPIAKYQIKDELDTYLTLKNKIVPQHLSKNLFLNKKGKRITHHAIYHIVRSALERNNLNAKSKNGAHTLRHSYASLIYKESNNLLLLQQLLGHSSIETTKIYTHLDESTLTNATQYLRAIY